MNRKSIAWKALGLALLMAVVLSAPASSATISFQIKDGERVLSNTEVTLFLSYGKEIATSNETAQVNFEVDKCRGFWVEVEGKRLAQFFEIGRVPQVIDVRRTGTMSWGGSR